MAEKMIQMTITQYDDLQSHIVEAKGVAFVLTEYIHKDAPLSAALAAIIHILAEADELIESISPSRADDLPTNGQADIEKEAAC